MRRAALIVIALVGSGVVPAPTVAAAADTSPPKLNLPPYAAFAVGTSIGPSADLGAVGFDPTTYTFDIRERAQWKASDPSGICGYDVEGRWSNDPLPLVSGTMSRRYLTDLGTDYDGSFGGGSVTVYGLWVTAHDCAGNTTTKSTRTHAVVTQENGSSATAPGEVTLTYRGAWSTANYADFSGGHTRRTTAKGASVTIRVVTAHKGEHLALVMEKSPTRGTASVYVDGRFRTTINTYAAKTVHRVIVFDTWLSAGPHEIEVVNNATKGHPRIDLDAVLTHSSWGAG
jgi:hypothetical protein